MELELKVRNNMPGRPSNKDFQRVDQEESPSLPPFGGKFNAKSFYFRKPARQVNILLTAIGRKCVIGKGLYVYTRKVAPPNRLGGEILYENGSRLHCFHNQFIHRDIKQL